MKKKIPTFETDEEAEEFVSTADLSNTIFRVASPCISSLRKRGPDHHAGARSSIGCREEESSGTRYSLSEIYQRDA